ncbi:MAG: TetR family transcriptional regulator C-terminal domain-containing protein [Pseudomonadota bacterium]
MTKTSRRVDKEEHILDCALNVFAAHGFRGSTLDQIAQEAGLSKPNLLYYFKGKEDIHRRLLSRLLENWLAPLHQLDPAGDPLTEIRGYIQRKLEMARDYPRESRLFANEMLRGAPHVSEELQDLRGLVEEKSAILKGWMDEGRMARVDPKHLIFSIWATTQHYADFDVQVRTVLGDEGKGDGRFHDAARFLDHLFIKGVSPPQQP